MAVEIGARSRPRPLVKVVTKESSRYLAAEDVSGTVRDTESQEISNSLLKVQGVSVAARSRRKAFEPFRSHDRARTRSDGSTGRSYSEGEDQTRLGMPLECS